MISVIFPPGGYGTFLVSCLYYFTELNNGSTREPIIDNNGSSHMLRHDTSFVIGDKMQAQLQFTHMPFGSVSEFDVSKFYPEQSVVLLGSNNRQMWLTYRPQLRLYPGVPNLKRCGLVCGSP